MRRLLYYFCLIIILQSLFPFHLYSSSEKKKNTDAIILEFDEHTEKMSTDSVIAFYKEILRYTSPESSDKEIFFHVNIKLSSLYRLKADFSTSLLYSYTALEFAEEEKNSLYLAKAFNNIGIDYYRTYDFDKAIENFNKGLEYSLIAKDNHLIAESYYKIAMVSDDIGKSKEALSYYAKAIDFFEKTNDCQGMADVYNGIAAVYYKKTKIDSTEMFALKAMDQYQRCGNAENMAFMYMNLATLMNMQKNHPKAIAYLEQGLAIADSIGALSQLRQGYKNLSETYAYMGNFEEAYKQHLIYSQYKDSIFNAENAKAFLELNTKYESEKKERQLAEQKTEIAVKNNELSSVTQQKQLFIIILLIVVGILSFLYYRYNEKKKFLRLLNEKNNELENLNTTKDKIFSILSHDLLSPISSYSRLTEGLKSAVDKLTTEEMKIYVGDLHASSVNIQNLLLNVLHWSINQSGHFQPKIEKIFLENIVDDAVSTYNMLAAEKNIQIVFDNTTETPLHLDKKMIHSVCRNIISNAIKFSPQNGKVWISLQKTNSSIQLIFEDQGPGLTEKEIDVLFSINYDIKQISQASSKEGTGLGLIICKEFMALNNGTITAKSIPGKGLQVILIFKTPKV